MTQRLLFISATRFPGQEQTPYLGEQEPGDRGLVQRQFLIIHTMVLNLHVGVGSAGLTVPRSGPEGENTASRITSRHKLT